MMKQGRKRKSICNRLRTAAALLLGSAALFACAESMSEEPAVVVESEDDAQTYRFATVTSGDVVLTTRVSVTYRQSAEQEVSFELGGRLVDKVYVGEGDTVAPGDLLAELSADSLEDQIRALEYRIARNETLLRYLGREEEIAVAQTEFRRYTYGLSRSEVEEIEREAEREVSKQYDRLREDYEDALEFDRMELAALREELAGSRLRAQIGGTVYKLKEHLEGSTSHKGEVIMTILDRTDGLFEASEPDLAPYFREGETLAMKVSYGTAAGDYLIEPAEMETWGETQLFRVLSGPEDAQIEVGTIGSVTLTLEERTDVLCLPVGTVRFADGDAYVYVLDGEGLRTVRWIETGLIGNDTVEILSGLAEGDQVVR